MNYYDRRLAESDVEDFLQFAGRHGDRFETETSIFPSTWIRISTRENLKVVFICRVGRHSTEYDFYYNGDHYRYEGWEDEDVCYYTVNDEDISPKEFFQAYLKFKQSLK